MEFHYKIIQILEFFVKFLFFCLPCLGWKNLLQTGIPLSGVILSETNSKPSIKYCSSLCSKLFWEFLRIWPLQNDFCLPSNSSKSAWIMIGNIDPTNKVAQWSSGVELLYFLLAQGRWRGFGPWQSTRFQISSFFDLFFHIVQSKLVRLFLI